MCAWSGAPFCFAGLLRSNDNIPIYGKPMHVRAWHKRKKKFIHVSLAIKLLDIIIVLLTKVFVSRLFTK